jgi:hypothetical protein
MRRLLPLLAALVVLAVAPAAARADGDPASDVLLLQDSYLPYAPQVSRPVGNALNGLLAQAKAKGYEMKVAIIASQQDLGSVPQLFGQPQNYALFLEREISFNSKPHLLVVMPSGYGVANMPAGAPGVIKSLGKPPGSGSDDLARGAIDAVVGLAKAAGHPVAKPNVPGGGGSGGSSSPLIIFGIPVALLVLAGILTTLKRRQAEADEPAPT